MKGCKGILPAILFTVFFSCGGGGSMPEQKQGEEIKTGAAQVEDPLVFKRFEKDLFTIEPSNFQSDTHSLRQDYGQFLDLYFNQIVRLGGVNHPMFRQNLLGFLNDPDIRSVYQSIESEFADLNLEKGQLQAAFQRYRGFFPDSLIPAVYTMLSGFSYNIAVSDSVLAIGLDMYLGKDSRFYELLKFPEYKSAQMHRKRIVPDAMKGFLLASLEMKNPYKDLITRMIYQGKILYLLAQLLPEYSKDELIGYSPEEWKWCSDHEAQIWAHFIDRKLFYSTDFNDEVAYLNDGPFTKGFPKEAPARIGVWLGFNLVESYMKKNTLSIQELIMEQDARKIFNQSKYKPGRA